MTLWFSDILGLPGVIVLALFPSHHKELIGSFFVFLPFGITLVARVAREVVTLLLGRRTN